MTDSRWTVILRATEGESLDWSVRSFLASPPGAVAPEIIVVSRGAPRISSENAAAATVITSNAKRIEAKKIGTEAARGNRILFLDSDQAVSSTLLAELAGHGEKMILIPERTASSNMMGRILDSRRSYAEGRMRRRPSLRIPVIPRAYDRQLLLEAFHSMPDQVIREVTETEDTLIFHECLKLSDSLGWCSSNIWNLDPDVRGFVRKSFLYGYRNERAVVVGHLPPEYVKVIREIQISSALSWGLMSPGAVVTNLLRGAPYVAGAFTARAGIKVRVA